MKLINQFSFWYLVFALFALMAGGVFSYYTIKSEVDFEQARYLRRTLYFTVKELENGAKPDSLITRNLEIKLLDINQPEIHFKVNDTLVWHRHFKRMESEVKVAVSRKINGKHFYIATFDNMVESDDITDAVIQSIAAIFLILLVVTGILSILMSKRILTPFNKTLKAVQNFKLGQNQSLNLPHTRTNEFKKLNTFLGQMTDKARLDYKTLKEFTENASHELQTPLAIIRGKLELLLDLEEGKKQIELIASAQKSVDQLTRMCQSLTLLAKLENKEFETAEKLDFSKHVFDCISSFHELIEMKAIAFSKNIKDDVWITIHPAMADILLNNLIKNAIRHNQMNGSIEVLLTDKEFIIKNTGEPLSIPADEIFQRFKKSNHATDSPGLGLAIVKQICDQNKMSLSYQYQEQKHVFRIGFTDAL